jgi:hypothetical protein
MARSLAAMAACFSRSAAFTAAAASLAAAASSLAAIFAASAFAFAAALADAASSTSACLAAAVRVLRVLTTCWVACSSAWTVSRAACLVRAADVTAPVSLAAVPTSVRKRSCSWIASSISRL